MRRSSFAWSIWTISLLLGCKADDLAPPDLRRPIEALPPGARALLLLSDVENTWGRLEAHQVGSLLEQFASTRDLLARPDVAALRGFLRDLETQSGVPVQQDLVLNALGGRAGVAFFDSTGAEEFVLVAELRDAARFRAAFARTREVSTAVRFEDDTLDGQALLRLAAPQGEMLLLESDGLLIASASRDLVRSALALRGAGAQQSAVEEPVFRTALAGLGPHNVAAVRRLGDGGWVAQGFTWDTRGLHFEHQASATSKAASQPASKREAILGSMPDGLTLALYAHTASFDWQDWLQGLDVGRFGALSNASGDPAAAFPAQSGAGGLGFLPQLPFSFADIAPWAGDELGIAVQGVESTALAPVPHLALVVEVQDATEAADGLAALEGAATMVRIGPGPHGFIDGSYGGKTYRTLVNPLSGSICPSYVLDGDVVVIATTRELLHRIIDTRRSGQRSVLTDGSFKPLRSFVAPEASMVAYADHERLHRAALQLGGSASMWGEGLVSGLAQVERASALLQHFPAGAAYVVQEPDRLILRAWMLEAD